MIYLYRDIVTDEILDTVEFGDRMIMANHAIAYMYQNEVSLRVEGENGNSWFFRLTGNQDNFVPLNSLNKGTKPEDLPVVVE